MKGGNIRLLILGGEIMKNKLKDYGAVKTKKKISKVGKIVVVSVSGEVLLVKDKNNKLYFDFKEMDFD